MRKLRLLLIILSILFVFYSCGDPPETPGGENPGGENPGGENPGGDTLKEITGVQFESAEFVYDGTEKKIDISGTLPSGVSVEYKNNAATDAGVYTATATLKGEGYKDKVLTATLTVNKADIDTSALTFAGATYDYDGTEKSISLVGQLPDGVTVTYTDNVGTNAGVYNAAATLTGKNYNTLTLTATLTISKITTGGISFVGDSFDYDGDYHRITVTGNIPQGSTVTYTGGEDGKNGAKNPGEYIIKVTVTHTNYVTVELEATLTIVSKEENLEVSFHNGSVYFQNSLDKNKLYKYDGHGLTFVSHDNAYQMLSANGKLLIASSGFISSSIGYLDTDGSIETLYDEKIDTLTFDGTYIYFNINSLLSSEKTGIYKLSLDDLLDSSVDAVATKIASVKSDWLNCVDGKLYFSNLSDGKKLYAIDTATNSAPKLIYDYSISEMINDGEKLYFVRGGLMAKAIFALDVDGGYFEQITDESEKVIKITTSNGKNLTKIGDYIFFINTDMLTSTIFGDGIYKAKADGSTFTEDILSLPGAKVVAFDDDKVFSLTSDGTYLYYFKTSTRHLYRYSLTAKTETDLMEGFVVPEYPEYITTYYEKTLMHNGEIYFINMKDGGRLYKYDPKTGAEYRICGTQVADFAIYGDYLYYTTVKFMVNFDMYRMSLLTGDVTRLSTEKCMNFSFHGDYMYYTNYSGDNRLERMNVNTLEVEVLLSEGVGDGKTTYYDGYIYFVKGDTLNRYSIADGRISVVNSKLKPLEYIIMGDKILFMNVEGFMQNTVSIYDMTTDTIHKFENMGLSGVSNDARGMFVYGGEFYYYRNVAAGSADKGLYKVVSDGSSYRAELVDEMDGYYVTNSIVDGDTVYFIDVWQVKDSVPTPSSTAKLYSFKINEKTADGFEITQLN